MPRPVRLRARPPRALVPLGSIYAEMHGSVRERATRMRRGLRKLLHVHGVGVTGVHLGGAVAVYGGRHDWDGSAFLIIRLKDRLDWPALLAVLVGGTPGSDGDRWGSWRVEVVLPLPEIGTKQWFILEYPLVPRQVADELRDLLGLRTPLEQLAGAFDGLDPD